MTEPIPLTPSDEELESTALLALADGPLPATDLASRMRRRFRSRTMDARLVEMLVERSELLVGRPDGSVIRLIDLLEGSVFTQRMPHSDGSRRDLWSDLALAPLVSWLVREGLCLASGDPLSLGQLGHATIVGPAGWLPPVRPGGLVSLTVRGGSVAVAAVDDDDLLDPRAEGRVRRALTRHYRTSTWWTEEDLAEQPVALTAAVAHALVEDPDLLERPTLPLDELLYLAVRTCEQDHHLRDLAAWRPGENVSFSISGMPDALHHEIQARARRYGMSGDQYAILALGHLCWRTPFAEDLGGDEWGWEPPHVRPGPSSDPPRLRPV
ncbi:hypothetical protein [Phycicoccus flavus]|uniref:hypothetical protein n=1 Tax=Phycicoccus flavus TaxID=2502783 RepID=UPI000FEC0D89|nr:hypothetical protein [Phycicoccus flavus]NHA66838.1 hypothetical protein [Phycicoccus flavus]